MTTTDAVPLKTLDPAHVSRVVRALLIEADRDVLIEDGPRRDLVSIPFDAAAAEDGLLPLFLVAGEAIWRDVTGRGFDLTLKRDLGALMSWRIEAIRAEAFSCVRPPVGHGGDRDGRGRSRGDGAGSRARI